MTSREQPQAREGVPDEHTPAILLTGAGKRYDIVS
jgi:hypothetical protein